jgi:hypothetical protein
MGQLMVEARASIDAAAASISCRPNDMLFFSSCLGCRLRRSGRWAALERKATIFWLGRSKFQEGFDEQTHSCKEIAQLIEEIR